MGCEQCKLLVSSDSEAPNIDSANVIANITAEQQTTVETEKQTASTAATATVEPDQQQDANQLSQSSLIELKPLASSEGASELIAMDDNEVPATAAASLIDLRDIDIDSNILDSTERLEMGDKVGDLAADVVPGTSQQDATTPTPPDGGSGGDEEAETPTPATQEEDAAEGDAASPDNNDSVDAEPPTSPTSTAPATARKKRGTVRVNSMRGHRKVRKLYQYVLYVYWFG